MAEEHKIIVELTEDGAGGTLPGPTEVQPQAKGPTKIPKTPSMVKQVAVTTVIQQAAKQVFNAAATRVGDLTGNYVMQNNINNAMNVAGMIVGIAINPVVGIPSAAINLGIKAFDYGLNLWMSNRQADYTKRLNGGISANYSRQGGRYL